MSNMYHRHSGTFLKLRFVADMRCISSGNTKQSCYKLVHQHMNWTESRANCKRLGDGADLVSVETAEENEFLLDMILGEAFVPNITE